jgi:hypothetical protein
MIILIIAVAIPIVLEIVGQREQEVCAIAAVSAAIPL